MRRLPFVNPHDRRTDGVRVPGSSGRRERRGQEGGRRGVVGVDIVRIPSAGTPRPDASATAAWEGYRRQADRYFRGALGLTAAITAVWLFFAVTGRDGGPAFKGYQLSLEAVARVAVGLSIMTVLWGWLWYGVKLALLRKLAGLSKE